MLDSRPLWPILISELTDEQIVGLSSVLREWAGVDCLDATVDGLREARVRPTHHPEEACSGRRRERSSSRDRGLNGWRFTVDVYALRRLGQVSEFTFQVTSETSIALDGHTLQPEPPLDWMNIDHSGSNPPG